MTAKTKSELIAEWRDLAKANAQVALRCHALGNVFRAKINEGTVAAFETAAEQLEALPDPQPLARPIDEWTEEDGEVLWWSFPIDEPPYIGSPLYTDWPDYHTHWTPIPIPTLPEVPQ
jgi:hypothetical protein